MPPPSIDEMLKAGESEPDQNDDSSTPARLSPSSQFLTLSFLISFLLLSMGRQGLKRKKFSEKDICNSCKEPVHFVRDCPEKVVKTTAQNILVGQSLLVPTVKRLENTCSVFLVWISNFKPEAEAAKVDAAKVDTCAQDVDIEEGVGEGIDKEPLFEFSYLFFIFVLMNQLGFWT
ncbi:hypothetical protein B0J13DRAFT_674726 [Dactylonectria estremocensis]|uniref:CCHC-type domain-containing protein n=1 Tax=Dactylonectria estremocensis TaxID=1079267 RepID=A0A9P9J4H5_9HYPO|nr:hypothetical protein B0J13DRAFT_674726 [Dactylonectria estremocensis]